MAVKKTYRINLRNYGSPPAVMVSQYDEGYAIAFEIFDGPLPVLASSLSGYTFKLKGRQPWNPPFLAYEFEGTLATALNAVVSFEIDTTMTGRAGKGTAELVILDEENDVKFASVNFAVYTEPAAVPDGSIDADVQRAMEIAEEVQEIVDTAAAEVKGEAEAWAVGQRDGEDVPSTDPTYENNAKYYAEQAQDIADSIGIDATLSISGKAADAKKTGDEISSLKEDLSELQDGGYIADQQKIEEKIDAWLDDHPEATTTVQNNSVGLVKFADDVDAIIDESGFYDEITIETGIYTNEDGDTTTYYLATIPKYDSDGELIDIYADVDMNTSPLTYAQKNLTSLTTNTSLDLHETVNGEIVWYAPACIKNGEIIRESTFDTVAYPYVVYVGFDANRVPHEYPITTPPQTMINDGMLNVTAAYYRLVTNGAARDVSNIGLSEKQKKVNPRICMFTKSDGSICFLACDGRENIDEGLTPSELAALMISKGAVQGWNLDGGGSTSLVTKGSKINRNIDKNGTVDRNCHTTWNVRRKFDNPAVQKAFAQVGVEKQRLIRQLATYFGDDSKPTEKEIDPITLEAGNYYIVHAINVPTDKSNNGFAVVMRKSNSNVSRVYWYPWNSCISYMKWTSDRETWSDWIKLDAREMWDLGVDIPTGSDFNNYTTPGKYRVLSAAVAGNISNIPTASSGTLYVIQGNNESVIIQIFLTGYAKFYNRRIVLGSSPSYADWALYSEIRNLTKTLTTDANGVIEFATTLNTSELLSMRSDGYIVLPYKDGTAWKGKVLDASLQPVASTSVSVTAQYSLQTYINDVT